MKVSSCVVIRTMFLCCNCFTERCFAVPRNGLKLDLQLGLHTLPRWPSCPWLFSRQPISLSRWQARSIVSQSETSDPPAESSKSWSQASSRYRNSVWRREPSESPGQAVEKLGQNIKVADAGSGVRTEERRFPRNVNRKVETGRAVSGKSQLHRDSASSKPQSSQDVRTRKYRYNPRIESSGRAYESSSSNRSLYIGTTGIVGGVGSSRSSRSRFSGQTVLDTEKKASSTQRVVELAVEPNNVRPAESSVVGDSEDMENQVEGSLKRPGDKQNGGSRRKKKKYSAESEFRRNLDMCSKFGDLLYALNLYDQVVKEGTIRLDQYAYNVLLYLCSSAALGTLKAGKSGREKGSVGNELSVPVDPLQEPADGSDQVKWTWNLTEVTDEVKLTAQERGFEIYKHMQASGVTAGEPTLTSVARLAVAIEDGDLAFEVIKKMAALKIAPKLRSYGPALFTYCKLKQVEKAFEVYAHMDETGVQPEEDELRALLELSVSTGLEDRVYALVHRLRKNMRELSPATVDIVHRWFTHEGADQLGKQRWPHPPGQDQIQHAIEAGGGGWHGLGWLGKGRWKADYTTLDKSGICQCCKEKLVTIDIDPRETESFAESLATLACSREARADFKNFQSWLDRHGPYDAIVDAANVGLLNQNFSEGGFNFTQVNAVVKGVQKLSPSKKLPLIVLHHKRTRDGAAMTPNGQQCLQAWRVADTIFTTPTGSNDDWYWLYAAVRCKCLLVTNDEMRDHLFQLLGTDFFPKWKERHQVRFTISKRDDVEFHMPPPYSIVIQESESGGFHFPIAGGDDITAPRQWLCVTRPGTLDPVPLVDETQSQKEDHLVRQCPTTFSDATVSASAVLAESVASIGTMAVEEIEVLPVGPPSALEETKEPKPQKKPRSPRSPRSPKTISTGEGDPPKSPKRTSSTTSSPRSRTKKLPGSPTLQQIETAEMNSPAPIDFQI